MTKKNARRNSVQDFNDQETGVKVDHKAVQDVLGQIDEASELKAEGKELAAQAMQILHGEDMQRFLAANKVKNAQRERILHAMSTMSHEAWVKLLAEKPELAAAVEQWQAAEKIIANKEFVQKCIELQKKVDALMVRAKACEAQAHQIAAQFGLNWATL